MAKQDLIQKRSNKYRVTNPGPCNEAGHEYDLMYSHLKGRGNKGTPSGGLYKDIYEGEEIFDFMYRIRCKKCSDDKDIPGFVVPESFYPDKNPGDVVQYVEDSIDISNPGKCEDFGHEYKWLADINRAKDDSSDLEKKELLYCKKCGEKERVSKGTEDRDTALRKEAKRAKTANPYHKGLDEELNKEGFLDKIKKLLG